MSNLQGSMLFAAVEDALVLNRPFGDSEYILRQLNLSTRRRLMVVRSEVLSAGRLLNALEDSDGGTADRVVGNPAVRCAVQHAHVQVETKSSYGLPLQDCEEIFEAAVTHLSRGRTDLPLTTSPDRLLRLNDDSSSPMIWREDYPNDVFSRTFRFLVQMNYGDPLATPSENEVAALKEGAWLLHELLPSLTSSALCHTHLIGVFDHTGSWKGKGSSSQIRLGGTIFLARTLLSDPWVIAEHLLHESLHQKLYDFRHGHSLLEPAYAERGAPRVRSPWNPAALNEANSWDVHRAFAAFHVYVQLFLLSLVARDDTHQLARKYGPPDKMISSKRAFERAWYLGEQLRDTCWGVLGLAGRELVTWLMSLLTALHPIQPPKGAQFHLLLDLYQEEMRKIESKLKRGGSSSSLLVGGLQALAQDEIESTRESLSGLVSRSHLDAFNEAMTSFSRQQWGERLPKIRELIAKSLSDASTDGYGLSAVSAGTDDPDAVVGQMILTSSQRLYSLLEGIPNEVATAQIRAHKMRFYQSCRDETGRLLAVLAASVRHKGNILEIGTGAGVGTAWLTVGLQGRDDVRILSLEAKQELYSAVLESQWPAHVSFLNADGRKAISQEGTFDLIFLDASPFKHDHVDVAIDALHPSGMLIIDDLRSDMINHDEQQAQNQRLRNHLFAHPALLSVELNWSTGIILCTRKATSEV